MALSASQVWEVRATGGDTNGGAFKAGASGTDFSQQNSPQVAVTDAVTNGATTITSATASFTSAHVGNVIYVSGGTASIVPGRYEITAVNSSTSITVDRATNLASGTGATLNLGGALASFAELFSARGMITSNRAFIQSGNYTVSSNVTYGNLTSFTPSSTTPPTALVGYATSRGDRGYSGTTDNRPVVTINGSATTFLSTGIGGWLVVGLSLNLVNAGSSGQGFFLNGNYNIIRGCKIVGASGYGAVIGSYGLVDSCEVDGTGSNGNGPGIVTTAVGGAVVGCYVHDCANAAGIQLNTTSRAFLCVSARNSVGFVAADVGGPLHCVSHGNSSHGISTTGVFTGAMSIRGNILSNNGGWGLYRPSQPTSEATDGNAYYQNTSGAISAGASPGSSASDPYVNTQDVGISPTLSGSPFVNASANDFRLNNTAGAGALLRGTAPLQVPPGLAISGYRDFGAIQHQDAGGGTTIVGIIEG